jgi:hypothetical protein
MLNGCWSKTIEKFESGVEHILQEEPQVVLLAMTFQDASFKQDCLQNIRGDSKKA